MTNLAELAGIDARPSEPIEEPDLLMDGAVSRTAAAMTEMGDLYRYTGVKPNHKHVAISD